MVRCTWESSFGSLLLKYDPKLEGETISHVYISKQENFLDPHSVPVTAPVSLCEQFSCKHVCIYLKRGKEAEPSTTRTVASVLMEASREPDLIHALCELKHVEDSRLYICGASLFPEGAMLAELVVVRQAIVCRSPIESQYHNSVLVSFPLVCYYCGAVEECLMDDEETRQLKQSYAIIYPICFLCKSDGKNPFTKYPPM